MMVVDQGIDLRNSGSKLLAASFSQGYKQRDLKHISRAAALWGNMCFRGTGEKWFLNNFKALHFHYGPEQRLRFYKLYPEKWDHTVATAGVISGLLAHYLAVPLDHGGAAMWESLLVDRDGSMPAAETCAAQTSSC